MQTTLAWLANGVIHLKEGDAAPRTLESKFGQTVRERASKLAQKNAWKTEGTGARFMGMSGFPADLANASVPVRITGLSRAPDPNRLLYSVRTDAVSGLFSQNLADGDELRLFHGNSHHVVQPSAHPEQELIVCAVAGKHGASHLAVIRRDGSDVREITEGDTRDECPCWLPGPGERLVYQSAGIGRDPAGNFAGLGPASLQLLDLQTGDLTALLEEPEVDLLRPRASPDGAIYFLRRPRPAKATVSPLRLLLGVVLLPFRLLQAVFGYLNFFSARYTGKPLLDAGGSRAKHQDLREMMIRGNLMNATRAGEEAEPRKVPSDWRLMKLVPGGAPERVASGVSCFDVAPDGAVFYSDGAAIFRVGADGAQKLCDARDASELVVVA